MKPGGPPKPANTVGADGLRYRRKATGSPFEIKGASGVATLSCFLCGVHRPRGWLQSRKLIGRVHYVCAPNCKELVARLAGAQAQG